MLQEYITSEVDILCIITDMKNYFLLEKDTNFFIINKMKTKMLTKQICF